MQKRYCLLAAFSVFVAFSGHAQTTYVMPGGKEAWLLDRLEIKWQTNNDFNLSTVKPYMRKAYVHQAEIMDSLVAGGENPARLTRVDQYNLDRFLANNTEYTTRQKESWKSRKPIGPFYTSKGNLLEVNEKDFYLSVNPVISQQQSIQTQMDDDRPFLNAKGVVARGLLAGKIGFHFYLTDNQERGPLFQQAYIRDNRAIPGAGFIKTFKETGVDYFDTRGSVSWNATKYINMQFGFDRNFIGNGYRSLLLSDFGNNYLFFKINTRIWKINYTNLYTQMVSTFVRRSESLLPRKFMSLHHFSINATKWLNIGLMEAVVFGRANNQFDLSYLPPVIFLRGMESNNGSPDNANIGLDFKANIAKRFQLYGQLMIDELSVKALRAANGSWANKQAVQLGGKYVDAFGIANLDLQGEVNFVRPFTYSHFDSVNNYGHYNQPLAHPLGANLRELIGIARYQPTNRLYLSARAIYWEQGLDSAGYNFGSNIQELYQSVRDGGLRLREDGYYIGSGQKAKGLNVNALASYEVKENLFIDASALYRIYSRATSFQKEYTTMFTVGLRWNMFRREYDY